MFPSSWWRKVEDRVCDFDKVKQSIEELLRRHPEPQTLIDYLNERRFLLLAELMDRSECIRRFLLNHPTEFQETIPGLWYVFKRKEDYLKELSNIASMSLSDEEFSKRLAYYRHRELMRIMAKEVLGTAKLEDILREYSELPDAMLELCYRKAFEEEAQRHGKPVEEEGKEASACIIGLGKLGSYELNYYSDIDLMFIHSSDKGYAGKLTLNEFFSKVFQKVFKLMTTQTQEGKPYEVDLDLRPFGRSGPISMSLRSAELYYESYGRTWERFALLRARYSAGDEELYRAFEKEIKEPFVFRKSVDYNLLEEIRLMKSQIASQAKKKSLSGTSVKTGEGGIREVEFTVQALVILLGGRHPFLRESNTFRAIWKLSQRGIFSSDEALFLERAYEFLRRLEHAVQVFQCTQKHTFTEQDLERIAKHMHTDKESLLNLYKLYTQKTNQMFMGVMPSLEEEELHPIQRAILNEDVEEAKELLKSYRFKNPLKAYNTLLSYISGREGIKLSMKEKRAFIKLLPSLVESLSQTPDPDESLTNFDKFFSNPTGRKVILSPSKQDLIKSMCKVFSLSSYLSTLIGRYPDLVEDVLTLYQDFPEVESLHEEFEKWKQTLSLNKENLYRRFKRVWEVRLTLVYLMKREDRYQKLFKFFEKLSELADFLLKNLYEELSLDGLLLISLGKYGSKELTVGSDLDLVFVAKERRQELTKKAQEFIAFLTKHTLEGYLYKLDFRLRPMGSAGELVPPFEFYKEYFKDTARTWERLAWTRCRYICGPKDLEQEFESTLRAFLFEKPITEKERREIRDMRFALESQAKKGKGIIDLKFAPGGLVDAEFLVQYYMLLEKLREPSMLRAYQLLFPKYPHLKSAYEHYLFLRLVETRLRLAKESAGSTLTPQDLPRVASSVGMQEDELIEKVHQAMKSLREVFLEVFD